MHRALLVIDIQNDYFTGGILPLWQAEETEARIIAAIDQARSAGDKIILVRHVSASDTGLFARNRQGAEIRTAIRQAAPDAPVVIKQSADAFQETDLAAHLNGIDKLLICGMMTQNCVVFTAMSNHANDRNVVVLADLCTAPTEIVHRIALNALGSKLQVLLAGEVYGKMVD